MAPIDLSDLKGFAAIFAPLLCLYGMIECRHRWPRRTNSEVGLGSGGGEVGDMPRLWTSGTEESRRDAIEYAARRMEAFRTEHVLKHLVTTTLFLATDDNGAGSSKDALVANEEDDGGSEMESTSSGTVDDGSSCAQSANTANHCESSVQEVITNEDCSNNGGKSGFAIPSVSSISDVTASSCSYNDRADEDLESGGRPKPKDCLAVHMPSECSICLVEYKAGEEVCSSSDPTTCVHVFHKDCIVRWLIQKDECPCCRASYFRQ